jgi:hypothetical protein
MFLRKATGTHPNLKVPANQKLQVYKINIPMSLLDSFFCSGGTNSYCGLIGYATVQSGRWLRVSTYHTIWGTLQ